MYTRTLGIGIAALLSASAATAATSLKEGGNKGGAPAGTGSGSAGDSSPVESRPDGRDTVTSTGAPTAKPWEVGGAWELHHLIRQEDLNGAGVNRNFNYFSLYGRWEPTPDDRISLRFGLYERLLADQQESGFRFEDIVLAYTRRFLLPEAVTLRATGALTAPTSFYSQKASLITTPRLSVQAERTFLKYVTVDARLSGDWYISRYSSAEGGATNPKSHVGAAVGASAVMPFYEPLSAGISLYTGYTWYYDVGTAPPPGSGYQGAVADARITGQPVEQSYGWELYVRYALPAVRSFKSDFTLALAQGDPTLGYASVLHDGVQHVYPFGRQTAEIYGTIAARY